MRTVEKRYVFRFVRIGYIKYMEMVTETGRNVTVNTLSMLVQERVIRVYEKKKEKRKGGEESSRRTKQEWRVVEAQRKIDAYLWDTFSKQVIFVGGRDITFE